MKRCHQVIATGASLAASTAGMQQTLELSLSRAYFRSCDMRIALCLILLTAANGMVAAPAMISITNINGRGYVSADQLQGAARIAVKTLPDEHQLVICTANRCALVKDFVSQGGHLWLGVEAVAAALGAQVKFDSAHRKAAFRFNERSASTDTLAGTGVGHLAPDIRLTRLDGTLVALSDFRGKRVLINSWASW
ncbi:MAG: peroxiredoxin family protein [Limisphaerales bacterium]